jgi:hypothetical protein
MSTQPYVFSATGSFDGGAVSTVAPGEVTLNDSAATLDGQVLGVGDRFGLARVTYAVAPGAPAGAYPVTVVTLGDATSLSDPNGNLVDFTPVNGSITILGLMTIPEPSSMVIAAAGALSLLVYRFARRRSVGSRATRPTARPAPPARSVRAPA